MPIERYQNEDASGFFLLEDGSGVLLLESSFSGILTTQKTFQSTLYHNIIKHWRGNSRRGRR